MECNGGASIDGPSLQAIGKVQSSAKTMVGDTRASATKPGMRANPNAAAM